jgi:hypothetical protein
VESGFIMRQPDIQEALIDILMRVPAFQNKENRNSLLLHLDDLSVLIERSDVPLTDLIEIVRTVGAYKQLRTGVWPLVILMRNAQRYCPPVTELGGELEKLLAEFELSLNTQPIIQLPEILIGADERLGVSFLENALRAQRSVARLLIPRISNDQPIGNPPEHVTGTGWIIGPNMLLTNHHVIAARFPGELDASATDMLNQARGTIAWFGYNSWNAVHVDYRCKDILQSSEKLDYALLLMEDNSISGDVPFSNWGRLSIVSVQPLFEKGSRLNIIQHPRGEEKRFAIRSNFYVGKISISEQPARIQYLTDTEPGASGSPIFNDNWQVIGMHHAAIRVPETQYKGEVIKYNNQGVEITAILSDLEENIRSRI